jgi:hypothetical protein
VQGQMMFSFFKADYEVRAEPSDIFAALKKEN